MVQRSDHALPSTLLLHPDLGSPPSFSTRLRRTNHDDRIVQAERRCNGVEGGPDVSGRRLGTILNTLACVLAGFIDYEVVAGEEMDPGEHPLLSNGSIYPGVM